MGIEEFLINRAFEEGIKIGIKEARESRTQLYITNLLTQTDYSMRRIAHLTEAPITLVKKVKKELETK